MDFWSSKIWSGHHIQFFHNIWFDGLLKISNSKKLRLWFFQKPWMCQWFPGNNFIKGYFDQTLDVLRTVVIYLKWFLDFLLKCNCISESILRFLRTTAIYQNRFSDFIQQGLYVFKKCSQNLSLVPFLVSAQTSQNSKQRAAMK